MNQRTPIIRGAGGMGKGGGGSPHTAKEDKDTLISKSFARVIDLLGEGEFEGFATANRPLADIYLDGTPVENSDTRACTGGTFTNGSDDLTTATNTFSKEDVGRYIIATQVPQYTYIAAFVDAKHVTLSSSATTSGSGVSFTVGGSRNWKNFTYMFVPGSVNQQFMPGFNATEVANDVRTRILKGWPTAAWVSPTFSDDPATLDAITIGIYIPRLQKQDTSTGDIHGAKVTIKIHTKQGGGGWLLHNTDTISGKTSSGYVRDYRIEVSDFVRPFQIAVERVTDDSNSQALQNETWLQYYNEITYGKLRHPNSALVGIRFDASQFGSIPRRGYHMKGARVKVPINYDPVNRTYDGAWNRQFKTAYTNNPAWCWFAMATNKRYGLGNFISDAGNDIDVLNLYDIAQYCDVMVPDGFGGTEPRFTCNLYLQEANDAWKVLSDMIGICRGMLAYYNGVITPVQDKSDAGSTADRKLFSPANVIDGRFSYSGTALKARHNAVQVSWNDISDQGELKYEYVEDSENVAETGSLNLLEIGGFGCSSRGQARRWAKGALWMEKLLTDTVTFQTALEGYFILPGQIASVQDPFRAGADISGRLKTGTTNILLKLDRSVTLDGGRTYMVQCVNPATGQMAAAHVVSAAGAHTELDLDTFNHFSFTPEAGSLWQLYVIGYLDPQLFRIIAVSPVQDNICEVTGLQYNDSLYDFIDFNEPLDIPPTSILPGLDKVLPVGAISFNEEWLLNEEGQWRCNLDVSWVQSRDKFLSHYICAWRKNDGNWRYAPQTADNSVSILGVRSAEEYDVSVVAVNTIGIKSEAKTGTHTIRSAPPPPPQPPGSPPPGYCYAPVFVPPGGQFVVQDFPLSVQLYSQTTDAWLRYTTNGTTPTKVIGSLIQDNVGVVEVGAGQTLKAIAYMDDNSLDISTVTTALYRAIMPPLPQIVGLEILGQGNNTWFRDENVTFGWHGVITGFFNEGPFDEVEATQGPRIKSYRVRLAIGAIIIYTRNVSDPTFTFDAITNLIYMRLAFGETSWMTPAITIKVAALDDLGRYGAEASLSVRNTIPDGPMPPFVLMTAEHGIYTVWQKPNTADTDIWFVGAFVSTDPADPNPVLKGYALDPAKSMSFGVETDDVWHVWLQTYDWFLQSSPRRYLGSVQPGHIQPANFTPPTGATIPSGQAISLWSWEPSPYKEIYYTTAANGNGGWQLYNDAAKPTITGAGTHTMYAQVRVGALTSEISSATWTIGTNTCAMPTFDPMPSTYPEDANTPPGYNIKVETTTAGASMWFTIDGSTPNPHVTGTEIAGTLGWVRIPVGQTTTIKILAHKDGSTNSPVNSGVYTINHSDGMSQVAKPVFVPPEGTLESYPFPVQLNCATTGAQIVYTLDGTIPTHQHGAVVNPGTWIRVNLGNWLVAFAFKNGWMDSEYAWVTYTQATRCNAPLFGPPAGEYSTFPMTVTLLTTTTLNANMRWTDDGTTPTPGTWQQVGGVWQWVNPVGNLIASAQGDISVGANKTIRAVAYKTDNSKPPSSVSIGAFMQVAQVATPTFNPPAGQYNAAEYPKNITLNCTTANAELHYTKDGTTPNQTSLYVLPGQIVSVTAGQTIKVIGYKTGMTPSAMASATYTTASQVATPTFNPDGREFDPYYGGADYAIISLTMSCGTAGATIKYTLNNTTPSRTNGYTYSIPFQLYIPRAGVTVKAMAYKDGLSDSLVHSAFFETNTPNL